MPTKEASALSQVKQYRQWGAVIGEDVDLIECSCNWKDATCLEIGNHVTCVYTHFLTHDASLKKFIGNDCNKIGRIVIGDNVFVGLKSIILPNVHIGNNVVIGADSVVTKDIPDNSVAVGNPARVIMTCEDYINKHKKRMEENSELVYWNTNRYEMKREELEVFNQKIDGEMVYFLEKEE
ncbi:MAG: hypothetical protein IJK89_11275 [Clostridia bacterium]|nr:hypothetical protein [Clostridia bacterium]